MFVCLKTCVELVFLQDSGLVHFLQFSMSHTLSFEDICVFQVCPLPFYFHFHESKILCDHKLAFLSWLGSQQKEVGGKEENGNEEEVEDGELSKNTHQLTLLHPSQLKLSIQLCRQSGPRTHTNTRICTLRHCTPLPYITYRSCSCTHANA